jgi:hypothetical protein
MIGAAALETKNVEVPVKTKNAQTKNDLSRSISRRPFGLAATIASRSADLLAIAPGARAVYTT